MQQQNALSCRCLFAAIDSLSLVPVSHHLGTPAFEQDNSGQVVELAVASTWLRHCLEERDLVRVLEPLLFIALHPRTHSTLVHSRTGNIFWCSLASLTRRI